MQNQIGRDAAGGGIDGWGAGRGHGAGATRGEKIVRWRAGGASREISFSGVEGGAEIGDSAIGVHITDACSEPAGNVVLQLHGV